jgi:hypothetical protein
MSGLPYNELQDFDITATDRDGVTHVLATEHYAFVIPCKECRYYEYDVFTFGECREETPCCNRDWNGEPVLAVVEPDGFCAWGEKRVQE